MISIIVATTRNRMIGKDNDFPWRLSNDLKRFRRLTKGHAVIMGRGNYDHLLQRIGTTLPDRRNIVVTRNPDFSAPGAEVVHSLSEAVAITQADHEEVFIIGGAQMYASALPLADRIYITEVDAVLEGDAFFPKLDLNEWHEVSRETHEKDEKHDYNYTFVVLDRKKPSRSDG